MFLKIWQVSQENNIAGVSFKIKRPSSEKETPTQVFPSEICEIFENNLFYITPLVAASVYCEVGISDIILEDNTAILLTLGNQVLGITNGPSQTFHSH